MPQGTTEPVLKVRGHTLLCIQGFRGEGYSPGFVANFSDLVRRLAERPEGLVQVIDEPDEICAACPHRADSGCTLGGPGSEAAMQAQDREVLRRLGLDAGAVLAWREVLARISHSVRGDDLPEICGSCRWLPLGYCREGLERLASEPAQAPLSIGPARRPPPTPP